MIDEEQYCIDILTRVSALTKAVEGVALGLLDDHPRHCVVDAAKTGGEATDLDRRSLRGHRPSRPLLKSCPPRLPDRAEPLSPRRAQGWRLQLRLSVRSASTACA